MNKQVITQALSQFAYAVNQDRITHRDNGDISNYNACIKCMIEIEMELGNHTPNASRIINDIVRNS